jgi:hypothetical protein
METPVSLPITPDVIPASPRPRSRGRLVNAALLCATLIDMALVAALVLIEQREPAPVGFIDTTTGAGNTTVTESDPITEESTLGAAAVEIPDDYVCTEYDLTAYEQFAGGEHNEGYFVADAYSTYLDVIADALYCTFMIGWPADPDEIELTIEVWTYPDEAAALEQLSSDRGNWQVGVDGTLEDYSGPEGDGFIYESPGPATFTKLELLNGPFTAAATMRSDRSLDAAETRSILLDMIDQAWTINAAHPR